MNEVILTPFQRGESYAKHGLKYNPYTLSSNSRAEFKRGYDTQLARTAGVPKNKEQPLP